MPQVSRIRVKSKRKPIAEANVFGNTFVVQERVLQGEHRFLAGPERSAYARKCVLVLMAIRGEG